MPGSPSADQRDDLDRQAGRLAEWATQQGLLPSAVVKEVGSGLNGSRPKLLRVLADPKVGVVVVEHWERLCRFGFEYVEAALRARGGQVLVVDDQELEDDLVRDVTEVMTALCAPALRPAVGPAAGGTGPGRRGQRRGGFLMQFTYQTRLSGHGDALSAYAGLYSRLERRLFARVRAGESRKDLKRGFIRDFGIPARMFNAMWASLQGKIKGVEKSHEQHADTLRRRIARAKKQLAVLERRGDRSRVHHKRRRLASLEVRLAGVEADLASGAVRLCFGSRKLWGEAVQPGGQRLRQPPGMAVGLVGIPGQTVLRAGEPG